MFKVEVYSINPEKKAIVDQIYKDAEDMVESIVKSFPEITSYQWCIAGGFASFIVGATNKFNDVDVYILARNSNRDVVAVDNLINGVFFDFILLNITDDSVDQIKNLLAGFDLDICRYAIINRDLIEHLPISPYIMRQTNINYLERMKKYEKRRNQHFNGGNIVYSFETKITPVKWLDNIYLKVSNTEFGDVIQSLLECKI